MLGILLITPSSASQKFTNYSPLSSQLVLFCFVVSGTDIQRSMNLTWHLFCCSYCLNVSAKTDCWCNRIGTFCWCIRISCSRTGYWCNRTRCASTGCHYSSVTYFWYVHCVITLTSADFVNVIMGKTIKSCHYK